MKKSFALFTLLILFVSRLACQNDTAIKVVSPVKGSWSNCQMLVIDNSDNAEYYYSINGSNPELSGTLYKEPVLLDATGDVTLKIARVLPHSAASATQVQVKYSVNPDDGAAYSETFGPFISKFFESGTVDYVCGSSFEIPDSLQFNFDDEKESFLPGQSLSIFKNNVISRYVPCTVKDELSGKKWRFIINTIPEDSPSFTKRDVPFEITDWKTITFKNKSYIYRIDDQFWSSYDEPVVLERNKEHKIYWQSINFSSGNPVECFVLPAAPKIKEKKDENGSVVYSLSGDSSYLLGITDSQGRILLYKKVGIDTFYGDNFSGNLDISVYSSSVYQGKITKAFDVKKRIPSRPEFETASDFYSRKTVKVHISSEPESQLYYSVSKPMIIDELYTVWTPDLFADKTLEFGEYITPSQSETENKAEVLLNALNEGAALYKIRAYSTAGKNTSPVAEYTCVVDSYNYFVNEMAACEASDGSYEKPFTDLAQCLETLNRKQSARVKLLSPVHADGKYQLECNLEIVNSEDCSMIFTPDTTLTVKNSSLVLKDCNLSMENSNPDSQKEAVPVLKLENSVLDMNNCQIAALFGKNGSFIDAYQSSVNLNNTIGSVSAGNYCSFVTGIRSRVTSHESFINVCGQTCVVFTLNESKLELKDNSFKVTGGMGRIAELFGTTGTVSNNIFNSELSEAGKSSALYKDSASSIKENGNEQYGFGN